MVSHHGSQPVATPVPANDSMPPLLTRFACAKGAAMTEAAGQKPAEAAVSTTTARSDRSRRNFILLSFPPPRPAPAMGIARRLLRTGCRLAEPGDSSRATLFVISSDALHVLAQSDTQRDRDENKMSWRPSMPSAA